MATADAVYVIAGFSGHERQVSLPTFVSCTGIHRSTHILPSRVIDMQDVWRHDLKTGIWEELVPADPANALPARSVFGAAAIGKSLVGSLVAKRFDAASRRSHESWVVRHPHAAHLSSRVVREDGNIHMVQGPSDHMFLAGTLRPASDVVLKLKRVPSASQVVTGGEVGPAPAELGHAGAGGFSNDTYVLNITRFVHMERDERRAAATGWNRGPPVGSSATASSGCHVHHRQKLRADDVLTVRFRVPLREAASSGHSSDSARAPLRAGCRMAGRSSAS